MQNIATSNVYEAEIPIDMKSPGDVAKSELIIKII